MHSKRASESLASETAVDAVFSLLTLREVFLELKAAIALFGIDFRRNESDSNVK